MASITRWGFLGGERNGSGCPGGDRAFRILAALGVGVAVVVPMALIGWAGAGAADKTPPGTYSGTASVPGPPGISGSGTGYVFGGGIGDLKGPWSIVVDAGARLTGSFDFQGHEGFSVAVNSGVTCGESAPVTWKGTISGQVVGAGVAATFSGTASVSGSTVTCTAPPIDGVSSPPVQEPVPGGSGAYTKQYDLPVVQMATDKTPYDQAGAVFSMSSAPSAKSPGKPTPPAPSPEPKAPAEEKAPASEPPSLPAPPAKLPAIESPPPPTDCGPVVSESGAIQVCVPAYLRGSATPGTTLLGSDGSAKKFEGEVVQGDVAKTPASGYMEVPAPSTSSDLQVGPETSWGSGTAQFTTDAEQQEICSSPSDCFTKAKLTIGATLYAAAGAAILGQPEIALAVLYKGTVNMANYTVAGIGKAPQLLQAGQGVAFDVHDADIEVTASRSGSWFYVFAGRYFVGDLASGQHVILRAGQEVFIPSTRRLAAEERLSTSIARFNLTSADRWWKHVSVQAARHVVPATVPHVYSTNCPAVAPATFEPTEILVACADSNTYIAGIKWSSWTATGASGSGTLHVNDCTPDCASGTFKTSPTTISLSDPVDTVTQGPVFATLTYTRPDGARVEHPLGPPANCRQLELGYC